MSVNSTKPVPTGGFKGSDLPPLVTDRPPRVLIAGGGLGGLFLGILLEKAGIPYEIFERSAEIKPLGAIMCLTPNVFPAFEQLGLYEELLSFSKPLRDGGSVLTDKLKLIANFKSISPEVMGYERQLFPRPELHNITIHGDILVGADGAHSAVRQHLYKTLEKQGLLPKADNQSMKKGYISLVGTTKALDPEKYPDVLKEDCQTYGIIGDGSTPYTWCTFTVPGNRICWNVVVQLGVAEIADDQFRTSDWVPQQNQKMMDSIRHFRTTYGTMGDLFDYTPIEVVSKVYFEDMMFETWHHGRTVLIGDAAHKLLPSTGAGAVNAMQDAVILANHLYDIKPTSFENIKNAFKGYKEERYEAVKEQYAQTQLAAKLQFGHTFSERIMRYVLFNWVPKSLQMKQMSKDNAYRPQANFLPQTPKRGTIETLSQAPLKRVQREREEAEEAQRVAAAAL
ncbi:hypothetical protein BGZ90_007332 [Linnemannia elongata]|nr:hypothetical protein BGZ90_007332 [Linnemannia elongata]